MPSATVAGAGQRGALGGCWGASGGWGDDAPPLCVAGAAALRRAGWLAGPGRNQGFLAPADSGLAAPADVEARVRAELGVADLGTVESALAAGTLTPEQVEAAAVTLCTVESAARANVAAVLRRAAVPYSGARAGPNEAIRAY
jgi:hypothetical protein